MANGIPPWLNIDPLAPVGYFQRGISQGQQAAEARNQALVQAQQIALSQANQAIAQQRAEQDALQSVAALQSLDLKRQENEREAADAARQLEELSGFRTDVESGMEPRAALLRHPGMFPRTGMTGFGSAYQAFEPEFQPSVQDIGGIPFARVGRERYEVLSPGTTGPIEGEPIINRMTGEIMGFGTRNPKTGAIQFVPPNRENLTAYQEAQLLSRELSALVRVRETLRPKDPNAAKLDKQIEGKLNELQNMRKRGAIVPVTPGELEAAGTAATGEGAGVPVPGADGKIVVIGPDGRKGTMPASNWNKSWQDKGWKIAPESTGTNAPVVVPPPPGMSGQHLLPESPVTGLTGIPLVAGIAGPRLSPADVLGGIGSLFPREEEPTGTRLAPFRPMNIEGGEEPGAAPWYDLLNSPVARLFADQYTE